MIADGVDLLFCNQQEAMMYTETETVEAALAENSNTEPACGDYAFR